VWEGMAFSCVCEFECVCVCVCLRAVEGKLLKLASP